MDVVSTALGRFAVTAGLALALAAASASCRPSITPLANAVGSASDLVYAVLEALERRDAGRLRELALDDREFQTHVWPDLPAARPERNLPVSYVWGDLHQKSEASLARLLATKGGQPFRFVSIEFAGGTTPYKSYIVHRQAVLVVRDGTGSKSELRAFGSVLEKNGQFKVFSYVTD